MENVQPKRNRKQGPAQEELIQNKMIETGEEIYPSAE